MSRAEYEPADPDYPYGLWVHLQCGLPTVQALEAWNARQATTTTREVPGARSGARADDEPAAGSSSPRGGGGSEEAAGRTGAGDRPELQRLRVLLHGPGR